MRTSKGGRRWIKGNECTSQWGQAGPCTPRGAIEVKLGPAHLLGHSCIISISIPSCPLDSFQPLAAGPAHTCRTGSLQRFYHLQLGRYSNHATGNPPAHPLKIESIWTHSRWWDKVTLSLRLCKLQLPFSPNVHRRRRLESLFLEVAWVVCGCSIGAWSES